jgi:hypothetical protein
MRKEEIPMGSNDETDVFFGSAGYDSLSGADNNSIKESLSDAFYRNIRSEKTGGAYNHTACRYDI